MENSEPEILPILNSVSSPISDSHQDENNELNKNDAAKSEFNYTSYIADIPELKEYDSLVLKKFLKKFGSFSKPNSLTNKERKFLKKLAQLTADDKERQKKYRAKRHRCETKMCDSNCKLRVAFDLSYFNEDLMRYVDMRMCIKQIQRCYSENRKLKNPLQFHITSMNGKPEQILSTNSGYENWDVKFHNNSFLEAFNKEDIVYLTSESENVLEELDHSKVFVIGGLLDHNSHKGLSYNRAIDSNIAHARLPIGKYIDMKSLKVLPINQVFSIIALITQGKSWSEALIEVIPQRKAAALKVNPPDSNAD